MQSIFVYSRSSRNVQRFPQIEEIPTDNFRSYRSTDFITEKGPMTNVNSPMIPCRESSGRDIPIHINRSRSCSGGRNKRKLQQLMRKGNFIYNHK